MEREKIGLLETFGIVSLEKSIADAGKAIFGKGKLRPTKFGLTSVRVFKPRIAIATWLALPRGDRKVPIYNFYNRVRPPVKEPYSVRVTHARDFMGGEWSYDSHLGTDFAVPVGTHIVTCAPGRIIRIVNRLDHGGMNIAIDHGGGLVTSYSHLARALVEEGQIVGRGQPIALSGAAGLELILFFPWVAPHLHLNVILNGVPVDPFAKDGEIPMWVGGNNPVPHTGPEDVDFTPTAWNEELLDNAICECAEPGEQECLRSIQDISKRAMETIDYRLFYNTLFTCFPKMYEKEYERRPVLDLPFRAVDFDEALFP